MLPLEGVSSSPAEAREPHRHDYHELIWVRSGRGYHLIDGARVPARPGSITLIGRGQVHVFECAQGVEGAGVRFGEELLLGGGTARRARLVAGRPVRTDGAGARGGGGTPGRDHRGIALGGGPAARCAERRPQARACLGDPALGRALVRRRAHRGARGRRLRRPAAAPLRPASNRTTPSITTPLTTRTRLRCRPRCSRGRSPGSTGSSTKGLVTDRVMVEAARLLRFSDLTAQQIAHRVGFSDPLYFSRAFKRHWRESPTGYRSRVRGNGGPSA